MRGLTYIADGLPSAPGVLPTISNNPAVIVNNIFNYAMYAAGVITVIMMVASGFLYIISAGRPDRTKLALNSIIYTAVGFGIVILARSIVDFVMPVAQNQSSLQGMINTGLGLFMWVIGASAVIVIVVGGIMYATSAGDPGKAKTAKDAIMYAAIGLGVAIMGSAIVNFLVGVLKG